MQTKSTYQSSTKYFNWWIPQKTWISINPIFLLTSEACKMSNSYSHSFHYFWNFSTLFFIKRVLMYNLRVFELFLWPLHKLNINNRFVHWLLKTHSIPSYYIWAKSLLWKFQIHPATDNQYLNSNIIVIQSCSLIQISSVPYWFEPRGRMDTLG